MQLGNKKINNVLMRLNDKYSLSISDLGRGNNDLLEGLVICNDTKEFIGEPFHFKTIQTLNELVMKAYKMLEVIEFRKVWSNPKRFDEDMNMKKWLKSDNVVKLDNNKYIEQTTQWKKEFTLKELKAYYKKEFN